MRKKLIPFVALTIAFAVNSAFTKNHSKYNRTFIHWFAIVNDGPLDDIETYDPNALTDPPQSCQQLGNKICAAEIIHSFDPDLLNQSDLTSQGIFLEFRYKN